MSSYTMCYQRIAYEDRLKNPQPYPALKKVAYEDRLKKSSALP